MRQRHVLMSIAACLSAMLIVAIVPVRRSWSETAAIPSIREWKARMVSAGQALCEALSRPESPDHLVGQVYYDAQRVFFQIADYTGDRSWERCAQRAEAVYRDAYVLPNRGALPGYWNFTHGLTMDYLRSHDVKSKDAVILLSQNAAYATDGTPLAWTHRASRSREVAYAIISYINAEKVGAAPRARLPQLVDQALGHIDQWFISKSFRCPSDCDPGAAAGQYYIQPFMVGITAAALIMYHEKTLDPRIPPALRAALDWLWTNAWVAADESFWYDNWVARPTMRFPAKPGAPDLNLLIAPAYAWLYRQTREARHRERADAIFGGGVRRAYLGTGKHFNQNYVWSFDYIRWRR